MFSEILRAQIKKVMNFALWFNIHWFSFILACCFMNWNVIIQFRLSWRHSNEEVNDRNIVALILLPFSLKCSLRQLFTRNQEIIGAFRERFIFTIIGFFLLSFTPWSQGMLMSPATGRNSDYIDEVFMKAWTLQKLETLYGFFLKFSLFN